MSADTRARIVEILARAVVADLHASGVVSNPKSQFTTDVCAARQAGSHVRPLVQANDSG